MSRVLTILLILTLLAACAPQPGVLDVEVVPAAETRPAAPDLQNLKPLAIALLAGLPEDRLPFVHYRSGACTQASAASPLACRFGEQDGAVVRFFPVSGPQPNALRPEEIGQILDARLGSLLAVYTPVQPAQDDAFAPAADTALLFEIDENGRRVPVAALASRGEWVGLEYPAAASAEEYLKSIPVENILLPPAEAAAWAEPLQAMQIATQSGLSTDRRWMAVTQFALPSAGGDEYYRRLTVVHQESGASWTAVDEWAPYGAGYTVPLPHAWAHDGQALFWTNTPTPDGCRVYVNGSDLYRLDLVNGRSVRLMEPLGLWVSLSPDEGRAAAVRGDKLTVVDLVSGTRQAVSLPVPPDGQAGQVVWSPDGRSLALTVANGACRDPQNYTTSVLMLNTADLAVTPLIEQDARDFSTQGWSALGLIQLADASGAIWQMDPRSGETWSGEAPPSPATTATAASAPAVTQIRFFAAAMEPDMQVYERLAREFAQANPGYQILFTQYPDIDYHNYDADVFLKALSETSDCFSDSSYPTEFGSRPQLLLDLAPLAAAENPTVMQDFLPNQLALFQEGPILYGLPLALRPELLGYNADLLERLGIPAPDASWTSADFLRLIQEVAERGRAERVYGFAGDDNDIDLLLPGLADSVLDLRSSPPAATFTGGNLAQALEQLAALRQSNALLMLRMMTYADSDIYAASQAWADGRVAFWMSPGGQSPTFFMTDQGSTPNFRMAYLPNPQLTTAASAQFPKEAWMMAGQNFSIFRDSPNVQACWQWYRFLAEGSAGFISIPARQSAAQSPAYEAFAGPDKAGAMRAAVERFYAAVEPQNPVGSPLVTWLYVAVRAYLDGTDAQTALQVAQHKADLYLACVTPAVAAQTPVPEISAVVRTCAQRVDPSGGW